MKTIRAIPKFVFDTSFSNEYIKDNEKVCFISILDVNNDEQKYDTSLNNFLQVKMWDLEKDIKTKGKVKEKPSDVELLKIVDFVNKHKKTSTFYIHCSAGVSRSGAVALFLYEKFYGQIDKEKFTRQNGHIMPNLYILNRLKDLDK